MLPLAAALAEAARAVQTLRRSAATSTAGIRARSAPTRTATGR